MGDAGASTLAAVLNETNITNLKCAAAPEVFAFVSAPVDTPTLSLFPSYSSLAVSETTTSEPRAPLRWLPSSTRRRSPTSSALPPPKCLLSCQRPLTRLLSQCTHLANPLQSFWQRLRPAKGCQARGGAEPDTNYQPAVRCDLKPQRTAFVSTPIDTPTLSPFPSCPSLTVSEATTSEPRAPLRWLPSSTRRRSPI